MKPDELGRAEGAESMFSVCMLHDNARNVTISKSINDALTICKEVSEIVKVLIVTP